MDKSLKYMGFDKLQDLGYNGQGLNALVYEDTDEDHGGNVNRSILQDGGGLTVFREYYGVRSAEAGMQLVSFVHANDIKLINISLASSHLYPEFNVYLKRLRDEGVIIVCAAGNEGADGHKGIGHDDDIAIMVGGATIRSDGKLYRDPHSGIDEEMDYMSLSLYGLQGTSFKAPILLRMIGCILQYLGDMDTDQVKKVLNKLCIDMEVEGVDDFTGNGLPVIDIAVLDSFKEEIMEYTKIEISAGDSYYTVDGEKVDTVSPIELDDGRLQMGVRDTANMIGADNSLTEWDNATKTATFYIKKK